MEIEIYKIGEVHPYIITNWDMFFELFGSPTQYTLTSFSDTFKFWNQLEGKTLNNKEVFEHLLEIYQMEETLENMLTKEF